MARSGSLFHTNYVSNSGNSGATPSGAGFTTTSKNWYFASGVDVEAFEPKAGAIVALGDSITVGYNSTANANRGWVDLLANRLLALRPTNGLSVVNAAIAGNNLHEDTGCFGESALHRLARDVLAQPGLRAVVFDEGAKDITNPTEPRSDPLTVASPTTKCRLHRRSRSTARPSTASTPAT